MFDVTVIYAEYEYDQDYVTQLQLCAYPVEYHHTRFESWKIISISIWRNFGPIIESMNILFCLWKTEWWIKLLFFLLWAEILVFRVVKDRF